MFLELERLRVSKFVSLIIKPLSGLVLGVNYLDISELVTLEATQALIDFHAPILDIIHSCLSIFSERELGYQVQYSVNSELRCRDDVLS